MVLVKRPQNVRRQVSCPGIGKESPRTTSSLRSATPSRSSFSGCVMGDEDSISGSSFSSHQSSGSTFSFSDTTPKRKVQNGIFCSSLLPTSTFNGYHTAARKSIALPRWVLPLMYGLTILSWFRTIQYRSSSFDILAAMDVEIDTLRAQKSQSSKLLVDARKRKDGISRQQKELKRTQRLFQHEMRMNEEIFEMEHWTEGDGQEIPREVLDEFKNRKSSKVAATWVAQRQEALLHKIYTLQAYVHEQSRANTIRKYGVGPHRVEFHVSTGDGRKKGNFVIEMAPIETVPHAIETFLDMITNKMWDNSVMYHHVTQTHVVAAAPVSYGTFSSKLHLMETMGYTGVTFPEYSKSFPHEKLTVGFAGSGPNFYINTRNNSDHHGPGGQGHHDLPTDADPCFGLVVSGQDFVLRDMMPGRHKGDSPTGWQDFDLSRIISARLMP